ALGRSRNLPPRRYHLCSQPAGCTARHQPLTLPRCWPHRWAAAERSDSAGKSRNTRIHLPAERQARRETQMYAYWREEHLRVTDAVAVGCGFCTRFCVSDRKAGCAEWVAPAFFAVGPAAWSAGSPFAVSWGRPHKEKIMKRSILFAVL